MPVHSMASCRQVNLHCRTHITIECMIIGLENFRCMTMCRLTGKRPVFAVLVNIAGTVDSAEDLRLVSVT
jgi:hypothetical protein